MKKILSIVVGIILVGGIWISVNPSGTIVSPELTRVYIYIPIEQDQKDKSVDEKVDQEIKRSVDKKSMDGTVKGMKVN